MLGDWFKRLLHLNLAAAPPTPAAPAGRSIFRKPISTRWRVVLGVASVVTIVVVYTLMSWYRQTDTTWLRLDKDTLERLSKDGVPAGVIERWEPLADGQFRPAEDYLDAVPGL